MEKSLEHLLYPLSEPKLRSYSALALAYVGDSVYDLVIRTMIVLGGNDRPTRYHQKTINYVSAAAQTKMMEVIKPLLTDEEKTVFKRGRNARSISPAKNQSLHDYRIATGLEALIGYLYLAGRTKRVTELIEKGVEGLSRTQTGE